MARHISTIKRGHYGLLEIPVKLAIFQELVTHALETVTLREKLDVYVEERQALAAARRDEALDEGRKRREEKERKKQANGVEDKEEQVVESGDSDHMPNGENNHEVNSQQNHLSGNRLDCFL